MFICHNRHYALVMGAGLNDNQFHVFLLRLLGIPSIYRLCLRKLWQYGTAATRWNVPLFPPLFIHASQINISAATLLVISMEESDLTLGRKGVFWKCYINWMYRNNLDHPQPSWHFCVKMWSRGMDRWIWVVFIIIIWLIIFYYNHHQRLEGGVLSLWYCVHFNRLVKRD